MAFIRYRGKTKMMSFRKVDTTAASSLKVGSLVKLGVDGSLLYAVNDSTDNIIGVCRERVTATDSTNLDVQVEVPLENAVEWRVETDSDGGLVDSDVGHYCSIDTAQANDSEALFIDRSDTAQRTVFITKRLSATEAVVTFGKSAFGAVRPLQGDTTDANIT